MKRFIYLPFVTLAVFAIHADNKVDAQSINGAKVSVSWLDVKPDAVFFETPTGSIPLLITPRGNRFEGVAPITTRIGRTLPLIARYQTENVRIDVNTSRRLPINITLPRSTEPSCHVIDVERIERKADSAALALKLLLESRYLLNISPPNDCYSSLKVRATKAQFDRNYDLVVLAQPLFGMNPLSAELLLANATDKTSTRKYVDKYLQQAQGVLIADIYAQQLEAVKNEDWLAARQLNAELRDGIESHDLKIGSFKAQGITVLKLNKDRDFIETKYQMSQAKLIESESESEDIDVNP